MRPFGGHKLLYMYIYAYLTIITSWISFILLHLMVILRSTTGPYGRLIIEVAYGEILFSLHQAVWEMVAREE